MTDNHKQPIPSSGGNNEHQPRTSTGQAQDGGGDTGNSTSETTDRLSLRVRDNAQNEIFFAVKKTTRLIKLIDAWCERNGVSRAGKRFLVDGSVIYDEDTPESLDMEDGDIIEVFEEQVGGADEDAPKERSKIWVMT